MPEDTHAFLAPALFLATLFLAGPLLPVLALGAVVAVTRPSLAVHRLRQGGREIAFVEMCHVGPKAYFDRVRETIRVEGAKGATYLYEKAGKGTPEETERLRRLLGAGPGYSPEKEMAEHAKTTGWVAQPQDSFLGLTGRPDIWADLSLAEILTSLPPDLKGHAAPTPRKKPAFLAALDRYDPFQAWSRFVSRKLRGHVLRQSMRLVLRRNVKDAVLDGISASRDRRLTDVVLGTPGPLVITYGAGHYPAFLRMLRESSPVEVLASERLRFG